MDKKTCGCFSWFSNMKDSFIERWLKFRSHFKKTKIDSELNKNTYLQRLLARTEEKALLDIFINDIINKAMFDVEADMMKMKETVENLSMSSSIISQIADAVVTESLTSITYNDNQSAVNRPKTLSEYMNTYGISKDTNNDGMPQVSD